MQDNLKDARKNSVADPDERADDDDRNADNTGVGDQLAPRRPRDLLHLGDDFPQEFDYFSHDRERLLRLFVRRVLAAELAVLAELQTIRIVLLVLVRAIVAAMALRALKRNVVAHEYRLSLLVFMTRNHSYQFIILGKCCQRMKYIFPKETPECSLKA